MKPCRKCGVMRQIDGELALRPMRALESVAHGRAAFRRGNEAAVTLLAGVLGIVTDGNYPVQCGHRRAMVKHGIANQLTYAKAVWKTAC